MAVSTIPPQRVIVTRRPEGELGEFAFILVQQRDELARAYRRQAWLLSVIFHLLLVVAILTAPKILPAPRTVLLDTPADLMRRESDLTYLHLPPDAQKDLRPPKDTKFLSDKDRVATSRAPTVDKKTLDELFDSYRPGPPGTPAAPKPEPSVAEAAPPAPATAQSGTQGSAPQEQKQVAKLEAPPASAAGSRGFGGALSAGSAIEQAARASASERGGSGGAAGEYGLGPGASQGKIRSDLDILSDTMGVDFGPYLARVLHDVRLNWLPLIPEVARSPLMKRGKVSIEFAILKDGTVAGMRLISPSGDVSLDRAAWGGITGSNPFPQLPQEFRGEYLALRFHFYYNPERHELR
jgi:TonB family protein